MTRQLDLALNDRDRDRRDAAAVRAELRHIVEIEGPKVVAADLDKKPSELLLELDDRDRHHLHLEDIIAIMRRDRAGDALAHLCDVLGYERPERRAIRDAAGILEDVERRLDGLPPATAKALRDLLGLAPVGAVALRRVP